ncbi:MAG: hypothetical protein WDN26_12780 [Chitinophagaceae bacterium]
MPPISHWRFLYFAANEVESCEKELVEQTRISTKMLSRERNDEWSVATEDASSNAAGLIMRRPDCIGISLRSTTDDASSNADDLIKQKYVSFAVVDLYAEKLITSSPL